MKKLSLALKQEKIELEDQSGNPVTYTVTELTGYEREQYMTDMGSKMKWTPDGKPAGMSSYIGSQTLLVQRSLRDAEGNRVNIETVKQWPQSVIEAIYEIAARLSALTKEAEDQEKNE
jgi:hypothetical protein